MDAFFRSHFEWNGLFYERLDKFLAVTTANLFRKFENSKISVEPIRSLGIFYFLIDMKNIWDGAPFYFVGRNSILIYLLHIIAGYRIPAGWEPVVRFYNLTQIFLINIYIFNVNSNESLGVFYFLIDMIKVWDGAPFYFVGRNSILIYLLHSIAGHQIPAGWISLVRFFF